MEFVLGLTVERGPTDVASPGALARCFGRGLGRAGTPMGRGDAFAAVGGSGSAASPSRSHGGGQANGSRWGGRGIMTTCNPLSFNGFMCFPEPSRRWFLGPWRKKAGVMPPRSINVKPGHSLLGWEE